MLEFLEQKFESLTISKQRKSTPAYKEIVFFNKDIKKWKKVLSGSLGAPVNASWSSPDKNIQKMTRKFGGIRNGQTLYLKEHNEGWIMAMIWPWKDKKHSTLKLVSIN